MTYFEYIYRQETTCQDESLEEHDEKYHPKGYKEGDKCALRDAAKKTDDIKEDGDSKAEKERLDAEYMDAVEKGHMETAQRMVREAARRTMPKVLKDNDGNAKIFYNGGWTGNEFLGNAWFTDNQSIAKEYAGAGKVQSFFIDALNGKWVEANGHDFHDVGEGLGTEEMVYQEDINGGAKTVIFTNIHDEYRTVYPPQTVVSHRGDPSQIKLADPVTYDDDGKVIPLSKRFDMTNPDIRY